jgi:hypothetical protein
MSKVLISPPVPEWRGELFAIEAHLRRVGAMLTPSSDNSPRRMEAELTELRACIDEFLRRHEKAIPEETTAYFHAAVREIDAIRDGWMIAPNIRANSA